MKDITSKERLARVRRAERRLANSAIEYSSHEGGGGTVWDLYRRGKRDAVFDLRLDDSDVAYVALVRYEASESTDPGGVL